MIRLFSFLVTAVILSSQAQANVYAEPSLGFGFGSYEATVPQDNNFVRNDSMSGFALGLRGGYKYQSFFGGLDLNYSFPSFATETATRNGSLDVSNLIEDFSGTNFKLGVIAGYVFDFGLRIWAGFNFIDSLSVEDTSWNQIHKYNTLAEGSSFKLGLGYEVHDNIVANLEYISSSYTDIQHDAHPSNPNLYYDEGAEWKTSSVLISVSYLYDFDYKF